MRFRIDLKIFLFVILFCFTKQVEIYAMIMFFAIIHELGHLLVGLLLGMKPEKLEIMPYGVGISFKLTPKDYNKKIKKGNLLELKKLAVAIAGPLTNLIIILITIHINTNVFWGLMILYSNLVLIIFNLLPIYPLDGGRLLQGIMHILYGKTKAEKYSNIISFITLILFTFLASIAIYKMENIAIFLVVLVLWCIFIKEDIKYQKRCKIHNLVAKSIEIK